MVKNSLTEISPLVHMSLVFRQHAVRATLICLCLAVTSVWAGNEVVVTLSDETEVPLSHHVSSGNRSLLWFPSEFGLSPRQTATAESLAKRGIDVWMADLHSAWFLPTGRYSLGELEPAAISELIKQVAIRSKGPLYLLAPGRTAALVLSAVKLWQAEHPNSDALAGAILLHPVLYQSTPQGGKTARYLPIAHETTAPIFIFQPQASALYWRAGETADTLRAGGAPVYLQRLEHVSDGFNLRPDASAAEELMTARLPELIDNAMGLLAASNTSAPPSRLSTTTSSPRPIKKAEETGNELLRPFRRPVSAPDLLLAGIDGKTLDLRQLRGRVVVLNFWATWCPPCVEEIPSLERLKGLREDEGLSVVTVDVGETAASVTEFLSDKPVTFPVLLDPLAEAFKNWRAYAFPTTFVLDRGHRIRYSVFGAFEWDGEEILKKLDELLAEPVPNKAPAPQ